ncbi:MAG: divalent metal cation transporter, partial [Opitutaceae bacterium]
MNPASPKPAPTPARHLPSDTEQLLEARAGDGRSRVGIYFRLLGPGWLQSALKLGGGTMTASLYLGVVSGFSLLWVQPLALFLGIIMLWGLGYVVMSTGLRPFRAITDHVNPVLGWGWVLAALASSMIWDLPQYTMTHGVVAQNLLPAVFGDGAILGGVGGKVVVSALVLVFCTAVAWSYDVERPASRVFDNILQAMVWLITISFIGVVAKLSWSADLDLGAALKGLLWPDFSLLNSPTKTFEPLLAQLGAAERIFWERTMVGTQRDLIIASAAGVAGVNGTLLFGYSVLRRKWGREFLLFSRVDLLMGMLLPVTIASSCVVIAGAHQFHTVVQESLVAPAESEVQPPAKQVLEYEQILSARVRYSAGQAGETLTDAEAAARVAGLSTAEKRLAAAMVTRDAYELAASLEPLTGAVLAHFVFGLGVVGMCVSSIILHMTVCGIIFCEMRNLPHGGLTYRLGSLAASVGVLGPFIWDKAAFWLAIPVAVFSYTLIPLTY